MRASSGVSVGGVTPCGRGRQQEAGHRTIPFIGHSGRGKTTGTESEPVGPGDQGGRAFITYGQYKLT